MLLLETVAYFDTEIRFDSPEFFIVVYAFTEVTSDIDIGRDDEGVVEVPLVSCTYS